MRREQQDLSIGGDWAALQEGCKTRAREFHAKRITLKNALGNFSLVAF